MICSTLLGTLPTSLRGGVLSKARANRSPPTTRFCRLTSHGFPYIVEVEHDGSAIFGQTRGMELTPASDVLLCVFTGRLGPRHFAGECAGEPQAVSLLNSTVSKGGV